MSELLLSFVGDDFTGSTDALESLALAGLRALLFTRPPTLESISRFPDLQAIGVASTTRSMSPDQMEQTLRPIFESLNALKPPIVHYKTCSTFDSSPTIGSIGRAIEVGADMFRSKFVPVLVGAPSLGRYCVFGNLFARCGTGSEPYRLDRHPSMSRHPTTPMDEADLRRHLGKQTKKTISLFDVLELNRADVGARFTTLLQSNAGIVLVDLLYESQLAVVGRLLATEASAERPLFVAGSSGVEAALCANWLESATIPAAPAVPPAKPAHPIVAVCGSRSPVTAEQINAAVRSGFFDCPVDPAHLNEPSFLAAAHTALKRDRSIVIHTGGIDVDGSAKASIGPTLGRILRQLLERSSVTRILIAGGDTSGEIAQALGIESLEMIATLTRGSPLCRASAPNSPADGREFTFKGGQIGPPDFFLQVQNGLA